MTQQEIADQLAIQELVSRYAIGADLRDVAMYASCFAEGAVVYGPGFEMKENLAATTIGFLAHLYDRTMHNVHNYAYTVTGDRATGITHCVASHIDNKNGPETKMDMYIRYHDKLQKINGEWKFNERRLEVICTTTVPIDPPRG
jgi:ketosteroid isomerase-like protein